MNILQLNKYITMNGGSESVMASIHTMFTTNGHQVWNMGFHKKNQEWMRNVIDLGPENLNPISFFYSRKLVSRVCSEIRNSQVDLMIAHNIYHHFPIAQLFRKISAEIGVPVILFLHDYKVVCPVYTLFRDGHTCESCAQGHYKSCIGYRCKDKSVIKSALVAMDSVYNSRWRHAYDYCSRVISPSCFLREKVVEMGFGQRIHVLPNPIPEIGTPNKTAQLEHRSVLYAGRLASEKGLNTVLEMARSLPDVVFHVAGSGPLLKDVQDRANAHGNLQYHGHLEKDKLMQLIGKMSFMVVPSIWYENNPLSIIESMINRLPVIGQHIGGIPELLGNERGILVSDTSVETWVRTVTQAFEMGVPTYKYMQDRAFNFIQGRTNQQYYDTLLEIMKEVVRT